MGRVENKKDDIEALIKPVFGEDYRRDLWAWVEAVALLQRKGYKRVQIMSLLYAEPASSWPALSRHARVAYALNGFGFSERFNKVIHFFL